MIENWIRETHNGADLSGASLAMLMILNFIPSEAVAIGNYWGGEWHYMAQGEG